MGHIFVYIVAQIFIKIIDPRFVMNLIRDMKSSGVNNKIVVLVTIQIILIIGSVLILTFVESQKTLLGNSINIAGKNGFLIEGVLLETEKYRLGAPFVGHPTLELNLLNTNIMILGDGGNVDNLLILPLSSELDIFWDELRVEYIDFAATTKQISNIKDSGGIISESDMIYLEESGQNILKKSNILVDELLKYSKTSSQNLIVLQIILAIVNIMVHLFLIFLIVRIFQQDLRKQIKTENELFHAKKEKFEVLGNLAANLAHDIRNPLSIIRMSLENLKIMYGTDNTKQRQFDKVERSIDRMAHQIDGVLDFVRETPLTLTKINTTKLIDAALNLITVPADIELILPKNNIELVCDLQKFSIVLYNIILNSIQSIVGSGTIEISVEENIDEIVIRIKDSGKEIPKEELDIIFEPLFTTKQHGTGLGLASVKTIVESHKGTISVTSPPVIFTITLPRL